MSLYNMLFGVNPLANACLVALGLRPQDTGRFRDCFIENGEIVLLTRNGGGNRECSHADDHIGNPGCKHHKEQREVEQREEHPIGGMVVVDFSKQPFKVKKEVCICEHPDSEDCACAGCIQRFRLPKHPQYLRDRDDSYDSTYAATFFRFPEEYAPALEQLAKLAAEAGIQCSSNLKERFGSAIKEMEQNGPPESLRPVGEKLAEVLGGKKE